MINYDLLKSFTEAELLGYRTTALVALGDNFQSVSSVSTRDLNISFGGSGAGSMTNSEVAQGCLWALQRLNPKIYGTSLIYRKRKFVV
jgi:hypothetical protein